MSDRDEELYTEKSHSMSPKRENGSPLNNGRPLSRNSSRDKKSFSRSPSHHSRRVSIKDYGESGSRSDDRDRRSRERSDRNVKTYRSRSRSRSSRRFRSSHYSRSHSRSYSYERYSRSRSRSPMSTRRRHTSNREKPSPCRCLGVFGLSKSTTETPLYNIFSKYGHVEKVDLIIDAKIGRSRGFGFVYFESTDDAKAAKEACNGMEIDGRCIRVDFSITQRPHTPTPGIYMGKPTNTYDRWNDRRRDDRDDYYDSSDRYYKSSYRDRRSPSPKHRSRRYDRSRSRSYSPYYRYRFKRRLNG